MRGFFVTAIFVFVVQKHNFYYFVWQARTGYVLLCISIAKTKH